MHEEKQDTLYKIYSRKITILSAYMFTLARYYVKSAILFLVFGLLLGGYMSYRINISGSGVPQSMITAHTHLILVGFVMMLIMGIALWLFPRPREKVFYSPLLAEITFYVMFATISVRSLSEIASGFIVSPWTAWAVVTGSFGEILGIVLFFVNIWNRIKPIGSHIREAKGEKF
jgi:heme/copper-type cytochrome/quinol oxidase subunit 1